MSRLEDVLRDLGERLAAPDRDLADAVMARLPGLPRVLRPPSHEIDRTCPDCPLPHKAVNDE